MGAGVYGGVRLMRWLFRAGARFRSCRRKMTISKMNDEIIGSTEGQQRLKKTEYLAAPRYFSDLLTVCQQASDFTFVAAFVAKQGGDA